MKCPVHGTEMLTGRCVMCGMTEAQAKARLKGSTAAPQPAKEAPPEEMQNALSEPEKILELSFEDRVEARFRLLEQHISTQSNTIFSLTRSMDRLATHVEGLVRSVDSLQSLALVHSAEFASVERLLGYMNAEREYVARQLGIKSMAEIKEALEAFHRERQEQAAPSPSGPIAPEEAPPKQEHDETAPNAA